MNCSGAGTYNIGRWSSNGWSYMCYPELKLVLNSPKAEAVTHNCSVYTQLQIIMQL